MDIHTELVQHELQRQKVKSPAIQSNSTKSFTSVLSQRPTMANSVCESKVQTGYVENNAVCSNSYPAINCNFKPSGNYRHIKLTTDIPGKNKKKQVSADVTESINNPKGERGSRQHKGGNEIPILMNFKVEDNVTDFKFKRINIHEKALGIQEINTFKEEDVANLKLKSRSKQYKGPVDIKEGNTFKIESNIKLEYKPKKETMEIQKVNVSELLFPANMSPEAGPGPSHKSEVGSTINLKLKHRKKQHQESIRFQKSRNSKEEDTTNLKYKSRNDQHKGFHKIKKLNSPKSKGIVKLEHKHINKPPRKAIKIENLCNSKKEDVTNLELKCRNNQHKGVIKIKKLNRSKVSGTMKFGNRQKKKPKEDAIRIQKLNYSEVTISAGTIPVGIPKPSHTLLFDKVQCSVSAMLQLRDANASSKTMSLFMDAGQPVFLVIQCIRIPKMYNKNFRFRLPHPLIDKSSDVCLFVPDLKKGKREDHEPTIKHYKDLLEKNNVTGISQVMPLRQVRVEYEQYELRRRLVSQFDLFLSDGRIAGHIIRLLGKEIYKRRKLPVPVDMRVKNLKDEFERALSKTLMMMNANGNKAALRVGHTKQSVMQIAENIMAVADCLAEHYPGGWDNIRSLNIQLQDSPFIPVYITLKSSNEVNVPVVNPVIPKKARPVEGELTTFPGTHVTVMPNGEVIVKKLERTKEEKEMGLSDSDWEEYDSNEEMDVDSADEILTVPTEEKTEVGPQPGSEEEQESDDGNEIVAEAAEDAYLSEWSKQWNANTEEESNDKKKRKQIEATSKSNGEPEKKKLKFVKRKNKKQKEIEDGEEKNNKLVMQ